MFVEQLILAEGGSAAAGFVIIAGIILVCIACSKPKSKGWNISHQGHTTVKPRK